MKWKDYGAQTHRHSRRGRVESVCNIIREKRTNDRSKTYECEVATESKGRNKTNAHTHISTFTMVWCKVSNTRTCANYNSGTAHNCVTTKINAHEAPKKNNERVRMLSALYDTCSLLFRFEKWIENKRHTHTHTQREEENRNIENG